MNTDIFGIKQEEGKIDCNDVSDSKAFQIEAMKSEPGETDIFTKCGSYYNSKTDFVDHKTATETYQEQNEEKLDVKNLNPEDLDCLTFSDNFSACDAVRIKNEDIDIFQEDIKSETGEEKTSKCFRFCEGLTKVSDWKTISPNPQIIDSNEQYEPLFHLTVSPLQPLEVQNESISEDEINKEQDSSAVPQTLPTTPVESDKIKLELCSNPLENYPSVKYQMKDMTEKRFRCKTCSKSFSRVGDLKVHERSHTGEKPFHCKVCSKSFSQKSHLIVHERSHTGEKPFRCKMCPKGFSSIGNLRNHVKIHTEEKPFHCKFCSKSFGKEGPFKDHERGHTGEKPFNCKICSKSFTSSGSLMKHRNFHAKEAPPFNCQTCSKSFPHSSRLKDHERIHTGEKPFHCKVCSKSYSQKIHLKGHLRSHTGEKPFECKICLKSFSQSSNLKVHERIHTKEKPIS